MKWFKHDSNASIDAKIEKLMMKYGLEGYGLYFYCLEMVARNVEKHNLTFELEHDAELIAHKTNKHHDVISEMMTFMVGIGLFENEAGVITCLKMATRTDEYTQKLIKTNKLPILSGQTPDTLPIKSELREENRIEENRIEKQGSDHSNERITKTPQKKIPYKEIVDIYHKILPLHSKVEVLSVTRKGYLKRLWFDDDGIGLPDLHHWENFFTYVKQSQFLTGQVQSHDRRPFIPNLEWLTKPANYLKITEGFYHG